MDGLPAASPLPAATGAPESQAGLVAPKAGAVKVRVLHVVPTVERLRRLAETMRPEDAAEVKASCGLRPFEALLTCVACSDAAFVTTFDGEPAAAWGVADAGGTLLAPRGVVWALTAMPVEQHRRAFLEESRKVLRMVRGIYPTVVNGVDARYERALRWVRWLGAEVRPAIPWGIAQLPFHPVVWRST